MATLSATKTALSRVLRSAFEKATAPESSRVGALASGRPARQNRRMPKDESSELPDEVIVDQVVGRVVGRYPRADPAQLTRQARAALEAFSGARVRSFLPVLIERRVVVSLRGAPAPS